MTGITERSEVQRSRSAILRIGATEEGVLRKHMITATGRVRDTVYFSILEEEWPRVRQRLEARLARLARPPADPQPGPGDDASGAA